MRRHTCDRAIKYLWCIIYSFGSLISIWTRSFPVSFPEISYIFLAVEGIYCTEVSIITSPCTCWSCTRLFNVCAPESHTNLLFLPSAPPTWVPVALRYERRYPFEGRRT